MQPTANRFGNLSPLKQALLAVEEMQARLAESERGRTEPIAIIGMGCRFPQAENPDSFWRLLRNGVDAVVEVPASRWDVDDYYDPDPDARGKMSSRWGGFIRLIDQFEPEFVFRHLAARSHVHGSPAATLAGGAWEALENAGIVRARWRNGRSASSSVSPATNSAISFYRGGDGRSMPISAPACPHAAAAGRLSYLLGVAGRRFPVDTACSSSLVSVHLRS